MRENSKRPNIFDMLRHRAESHAADGEFVGGETEVYDNVAYSSRTERGPDGHLYRVTQEFHKNELGVVVPGKEIRVRIRE